MQIKILKVKDGSFLSDDGSGKKVPFFWHDSVFIGGEKDGVEFSFGSKNEHAVGVYDLDLFKAENSRGRIVWKERIA